MTFLACKKPLSGVLTFCPSSMNKFEDPPEPTQEPVCPGAPVRANLSTHPVQERVAPFLKDFKVLSDAIREMAKYPIFQDDSGVEMYNNGEMAPYEEWFELFQTNLQEVFDCRGSDDPFVVP